MNMDRAKSISNLNKFRKWQKVVQPIVKYSRSTSPLCYPLDFFYQLQQILSNGHNIRLNIATTLSGAKDNCIKTVFEGDEQIGTVKFSAAILKSSFDSQVQRQWQERIGKFCQRDNQFQTFITSLKDNNNATEQILPCALIKQKSVEQGGAIDYRVLTLSKDQYKKIVNLQVNQIAQCFIWGCGKQTSIIRFFYYPQKQNSQAFKIDNLEGFMKRRFGKSQFKVREQAQNSLTFVKIMYNNKSFYNQTLKLVEFLEKHLKISIQKIVTDWILDPNNRYFFIDLKEIRYTNKPQVVKITRSITDSLSYITCSVCQQKFKNNEITKMLTNKLISQFFEHLKKRQIALSFTPLCHTSNDISRLCDLCYMLVVSQAELIQLEHSVAIATHSMSMQRQPLIKWAKHNQYGQMYEWRLFLYLEDLRDLYLDQECEKGFYVMMRLHNSITAFKLKDHNSKYNLIKGIKIHYLFSEHAKIQKFLSSSQIAVRITRGQNWNAVVAQGSTSGLYEQSQKYSMRKFKQILVFDAKSRYSVIGMHIGLKLQGKYNPEQLTLIKYHDVYMVDNYSNCYSLPAEWMQTIDPSYCISKSQSTSFNYGLHLNPAEKKLLFPDVTVKKKKLVL